MVQSQNSSNSLTNVPVLNETSAILDKFENCLISRRFIESKTNVILTNKFELLIVDVSSAEILNCLNLKSYFGEVQLTVNKESIQLDEIISVDKEIIYVLLLGGTLIGLRLINTQLKVLKVLKNVKEIKTVIDEQSSETSILVTFSDNSKQITNFDDELEKFLGNKKFKGIFEIIKRKTDFVQKEVENLCRHVEELKNDSESTVSRKYLKHS